ncbi:hypothetical protein HPC49_47595 [Pyxidicoccus fallax]|uniref:Uncharacterized protein n=1 Tax=Pyxidicoccus fallax TaxID=394095 RepID=A0A848LGT1_9BACT|nr:hypothetical protein [Pyxidicoccus fallax]NMO16655.1 hypothetical protein [Pyxidicoccus fallax]NPC85843.1 hypothetical protein [Pyxidicoccus fallax]
MRVRLLVVSLWLLAVPLGAGAQAPPQPSPPPPVEEEGTQPITGERPVPGAPEDVGEHEQACHPVPPTGAVGSPPSASEEPPGIGGSGTVAPAPDEKKSPTCPCLPEDPAGPCPCPLHGNPAMRPCPPGDAEVSGCQPRPEQ